MRLFLGAVCRVFRCVVLVAACGFPQPARVGDDGPDSDAGPGSDAEPPVAPICEPNQPLRCSPGALVRCSADGTAEVSESCPLGCTTAELRCKDVIPSNGLALHLDMTADVPDLDLGMNATIDTDTGAVIVDKQPIAVRHAAVEQSPAPSIRVFMVHSLTARDVIVTGTSALAIVSHGDVTILGKLSVSGFSGVSGPGAFNEGGCAGGDVVIVGFSTFGGPGGGGFGAPGGMGGSATSIDGTSPGGIGGKQTGNPSLVPLRGGCNGGRLDGSGGGAAGGAVQLVSRSSITISGIVAANGMSGIGGGSGGGILLEAATVDVTGAVVANGGAGAGGCFFPRLGENGRLDAMPAAHGLGCSGGADGGNGGARNGVAGSGLGINTSGNGGTLAWGGHGGGGVGRIRVNTVPGGLHVTGVISPSPTTGELESR